MCCNLLKRILNITTNYNISTDLRTDDVISYKEDDEDMTLRYRQTLRTEEGGSSLIKRPPPAEI